MKINFGRLKENLLETVIILAVSVTILCFFDYTHWTGIEEEEDKNIVKKIFNRLYFATTTMSSVGYGDVSPKSYGCRGVVMFVQILVILHILSVLGRH
jgi:hypothetical protein